MLSRPWLWVLPANVVGGAETWTRGLMGHLAPIRSTILTHRAIGHVFSDTDASLVYLEDYGCRNPYLYSVPNLLRYARAISRVSDRVRPGATLGLMHNGVVFLALAGLLGSRQGVRVGSIMGHLSTFFQRHPGFASQLQRVALIRSLGRMHGILTPSGGVADDLVQCFGVARDRVRVIHNGLPLADLRARAAIVPPTYPKTHPWIVTACRLRRGAKDFETLFSGFKRVRARADAELVILGEGPDRAGLEADCSALGIGDQVRFLGYHANPMPYLAAADVFVLSSLAEGFGNVLVEAMAVGTPVVATDCPSGPREILRGGEDGLLVPIRDPEGLANACLSLLLDPGLRQRFAERGRARSEAFDAPAKAAELQDYLSRLGWG